MNIYIYSFLYIHTYIYILYIYLMVCHTTYMVDTARFLTFDTWKDNIKV